MKRIFSAICLLSVTAMLTLTMSGCDIESLWQSAKYNAMEDIAEDILDGDHVTKEDILHELGRPNGYYNAPENTYMARDCQVWSYEEFDFSGYPYGLVVQFSKDGTAVSASFGPGKGG